MTLKNKIVITGHAEHGKDTACEYLRDNFNISFKSSSFTACEVFIFDELKEQFGYKSKEECFADRRNNRKLWADLITDFNNTHGLDAIGKIIFKDADCYNGIRKIVELNELKTNRIVDLVIWIDASDRKPLESRDSMDIPISSADIVILNNGSISDFHQKLNNVGRMLSNF